jgi:hypothetical protein
MTFEPSPAGSPGVFLLVCLLQPKLRKDGLHGLIRFFRALAKSAGTASRWFLLSWDSSVALPPAYLPHVHSRKPKLPSVRRCQAPNRVPPLWFRTTSTVYSAQKSRVCCTPQPVKGSPRFMRAACTGHPKATRLDGYTPRDAVHTLRRFPLVSSRTTSLWPLPSCRYRLARRQAPAEAGVSCRPPAHRGGWRTVRESLPAGRRWPCPEGLGGRCPVKWGVRAS